MACKPTLGEIFRPITGEKKENFFGLQKKGCSVEENKARHGIGKREGVYQCRVLLQACSIKESYITGLPIQRCLNAPVNAGFEIL